MPINTNGWQNKESPRSHFRFGGICVITEVPNEHMTVQTQNQTEQAKKVHFRKIYAMLDP